MESDQQFCLRWNNHQSTVLGVLNSLLDNGWLADCMIAAEGRSMKAHRFVLTACSPYFQSLLDQNYDRHPIIILKDIKYDELVAMMDYMYRGVVNTSQDKLSSLLAAAESLQIKGLSDTGESKEPTDNRPYESFQQAPSPPALPQRPGLTIEQRHPKQDIQMSLVRGQQPNSPMAMPVTSYRMTESREGSMSPIPRKRKKARRHDSVCDEASQSYGGMENHSTSDSMEMPSQMPAIHTNFTIMPATSTPSVPTANEPEIKSSPVDLAEAEILNRGGATSMGEPSPRRVSAEEDQNLEPPGALLIPKAEYIEEDIKEDSVEEVTLDDDLTDDMDHAQAGPSHGGDGSGSQGFAPWHVAGDQSTDEVFLAAQEAVGTHRDPQDLKQWDGFQNKIPSVCQMNTENSSQTTSGDLQKSNDIKYKGFVQEPRPNGGSRPSQTVTVSECDFENLSKALLYRREIQMFPKDSGQSSSSLNPPEIANRDRDMSDHTTMACVDNEKRVCLYDTSLGSFQCQLCFKMYQYKSSLLRHIRLECGKDPQFRCPYCPHVTKHKSSLIMHMDARHKAHRS